METKTKQKCSQYAKQIHKLNYVKILSAKSECVFVRSFIEKHWKNGERGCVRTQLINKLIYLKKEVSLSGSAIWFRCTYRLIDLDYLLLK